MNGLTSDSSFCSELLQKAAVLEDIELGICPPAMLVGDFVKALEGSPVKVGVQDCHAEDKGAHTGDISAPMVRDIGAHYVILGHSERRRDHYETSSMVALKVGASLDAGLVPIVCIGELLEKREAGDAIQFVLNQLSRSLPSRMIKGADIMVAYEPIWAIGTGRAAEPDDIVEMHTALRSSLVQRFGNEGNAIKLLYGGSVTADKAEILTLENVDGALVGGASLRVDSFLGIATGYRAIIGTD